MARQDNRFSSVETAETQTIGRFPADTPHIAWDDPGVGDLLKRPGQAAWIIALDDGYGFVVDKGIPSRDRTGIPVMGYLAPCLPENLGDPSFRRDHGLRYSYYTGSMANGIASVDLVEAVGKEDMLGFFGSAGLAVEEVGAAIDALTTRLEGRPFGFNLINSINEPYLEKALVDLYINRNINLIEAAAYMDLSLPLVRYRVHGIHQDSSGRLVTPNRIIAKVSREEVAAKFFSPPPAPLLYKLVEAGEITREEADLAAHIPMAQDVTAEADSGGHTDNRSAITLVPTLAALRDRMQETHGFDQTLRVGLAGGICTPQSAAAAFAMGAAYIVTGSVNQACVESGTCDEVRRMLAETRQADIAMAPAADMFEMGVTVQVLKRGTMFSMRAAKLYELYQMYNGIHEIPEELRSKIEKTIFRNTLETTWQQTRTFFLERDPDQVTRAEEDPKHKMALIFRSYLGLSSLWANRGEPSRKIDYQVWCGPAMGAFNEWTRGTFLEEPSNRSVAAVALNLLHGAAVLTRCNQLRNQGFPLPPDATRIVPVEPDQLRSEYVDRI